MGRTFALLLLAVLAAAAAARAQTPPDLPREFSAVFEKTDRLARETSEHQEDWDQDNQRVRIRQVGPKDHPDVEIFDYARGTFYRLHDGQCTSTATPPAGSGLGDGSALRRPEEVFALDPAAVVYSGRKAARGIQCDTWTGTVSNATAGDNYTTVWYFSAPGWTFRASPSETRVPVRVTTTGEVGGVATDTVWEWVDFRPGPPPDAAFAPPADEPACPHPVNREVPSIPDDYYIVEESIDVLEKRASTFRQWHDYTNNRLRFQRDSGAVGDDDSDAFAIIILLDEDKLYMRSADGCRVFQPVPDWAAGLGVNRTAHHLAHPYAFEVHSGTERPEPYYVGRTTVRGIAVDHWRASVRASNPEGDEHIVAWYEEDFYSAAEDWTVAGRVGDRLPVGTRTKGYYEKDRDPARPFEHATHFMAGYVGAIPANHFEVDADNCPRVVNTSVVPLGAVALTQEPPAAAAEGDDNVSSGLAAGLAFLFLFVGVAAGYFGARLCCNKGRTMRARGSSHVPGQVAGAAGTAAGASTQHVELTEGPPSEGTVGVH